MANNPKKVKDPTEVAFSAIQEALNISDTSVADRSSAPQRRPRRRSRGSRRRSTACSRPARPLSVRLLNRSRRGARRRPANDDRGNHREIRRPFRRRPAATSTRLPHSFTGVWLAGCALLNRQLPSLQAAIGQGPGGTLVLAGLAALFFAPVLLFYFLANLSWRGQGLPYYRAVDGAGRDPLFGARAAASDLMVSRRSAAKSGDGDGVERAIARAGELETLVANEIGA